jgi:hypothetical protein
MLMLIRISYIGIKPKNEQKNSFDPQTRGAMTSGPFKDGFLQTFHATSNSAARINVVQYLSVDANRSSYIRINV